MSHKFRVDARSARARSTIFAGTTCPPTTKQVCDRFDLTVDVDAAHREEHRGGVEIRISWASAEDDFDLHVFDAHGNRVASSIAANTTSERVLIEKASGVYSVRANPFAVTDSDYEGEVELHSRKLTRKGGGAPKDAVFDQPCVGGLAGGFPCKGVDLGAFMPHASIGGGEGNDIWGRMDPDTGREYALVGKTIGTAFVDVTEPTAPVYLGLLPSHQPVETFFSIWRDVKVYANHAFVVSEEPSHGMQVFDLTRLRGVTAAQQWTEDAHYPLFGGAHNVAIDEQSGFAYAVFAGCAADDGYTHDAQCVVYRGPDAAHQGRQICLNSNEDTLTIVDVTDKLLPRTLSRTTYPNAAYTHQGWLTEDQRHFLLGDELDEVEAGVRRRRRRHSPRPRAPQRHRAPRRGAALAPASPQTPTIGAELDVLEACGRRKATVDPSRFAISPSVGVTGSAMLSPRSATCTPRTIVVPADVSGQTPHATAWARICAT